MILCAFLCAADVSLEKQLFDRRHIKHALNELKPFLAIFNQDTASQAFVSSGSLRNVLPFKDSVFSTPLRPGETKPFRTLSAGLPPPLSEQSELKTFCSKPNSTNSTSQGAFGSGFVSPAMSWYASCLKRVFRVFIMRKSLGSLFWSDVVTFTLQLLALA